MPDERPDDPAPGGWLPPTGGDEPVRPPEPAPSAPAGWLPPSEADYTPPASDPYPHAGPTGTAGTSAGGGASSWPGRPAPSAPWGGAPENLGKATASLALAVVGLFLCPVVFSVAAIVVGRQAQTEMRANPSRYGNDGQAKWGVNLGWVGLALGLLLIVLIAAGVPIAPSGDE